MKVLDVINPFKAMVQEEILEETRLSTEFTIGFELEGICDSDDPELEDSGRRPSYHSGAEASGGSAVLKDKLNKLLNMGEGNLLSLSDGEIANIMNDGEIIWNSSTIPGKWKITRGNRIIFKNDGNEETVGNISGSKIVWEDNAEELVGEKLPKNVTINRSKIEGDGSVHPDEGTNATGHAWSFEWGSPIIRFNPTNIKKIKNFLLNLADIGVYTNNSCGFHTHISFDSMTRDDAKWILFCIANDDNLLDDVSYLRVPGEEPVKFFGNYAKDEWFQQLKVKGNIKNWHFNSSTSDKYLIIRIHPDAGTLEWRGPRNFINNGDSPELIEGYLQKLYKLVLKIAKLVDENEYNGFKKKEVLERMTIRGEFNTKTEKLTSLSVGKLKDLIVKKPDLYVTIKPSKIKSLMDADGSTLTSTYTYSDDAMKEFRNIWSKIPVVNKKHLIDTAVENNNPQFIFNIASNPDTKKVDVVTSELLIDAFNKTNSMNTLLRDYASNLQIDDEKVIEKIYNSSASKKLVFAILARNPRLVSLKILTQIANSNDRYILSSFSTLPVKIQRILIRKNPYNIQYINNPDQSIINELKKKYGDDINDYILGVL